MTSSIAATTSSVLTGTPLPSASPTSTLPRGGGSGSAGDGGVIAGAVIAVLILLVIAVALTVVILLLVKQRSKSKSLNGSLWYIKTSPGAQRKKVPSYLSEGTQFAQEVSSRHMTPEFLVVRHKKPKSTVPNASIFCYSERPTSIIQPAQRWSERSSVCPVTTMTTHRDTTPTLSTGDVTLPRHIRDRSSSVDTNSTQPFGGSSTAASSLSRPGKSLKVYQMPSVEDDNIILTNESERSLKTLSL